MRIERTKNAGRNMVFGTVLKIYQIIIPFIMRTIMIYQLGIEYAGLNNLFTSIFQVLNLAELGIGAALTCSMYKPIAEDDTDQICALLKLYKKCFNIIGTIILGLGVICTPFLPDLINGHIPDDLNLYVLYGLYLVNTVLSYWLFSYKKSLIFAHQRIDINSKVLLITNTIQYLGQAFVLFILKNYYLYLLVAIVCQLLNNIISAKIVDKIYPKYKPVGKLSKEVTDDIKKKVQGLITNKIGGVILRSTDSIVISAFLGLTVLAVYQNYYFILTAIISIIAVIFDACIAGIGNSLVTESSDKNYTDFCTMTFFICWITSICCCGLLLLFQPFITLWVGSQYIMEYPLVVCMVIYFFVYEIDSLIGTFKDAAGIWYSDRYRPLITALVNLGLNILLVNIIGLYGILLSTVISMVFIGIPWLVYNVFKSLFKNQSLKKYLLLLLKFIALTVISCFLSVLILNHIDTGIISDFVIGIIITITIPNIMLFLFFIKSDELHRTLSILNRLVKER